jgi:hypothetical protein
VSRGTGHLHEWAHCRAGDKGDDSILVLVPHDHVDVEWLVDQIDVETIARHFGGMDPALVTVVTLPSLPAMVLTLRGRLAGGVTRSTGVDPHGKTLSGHLLDLPVTPSGPGADPGSGGGR